MINLIPHLEGTKYYKQRWSFPPFIARRTRRRWAWSCAGCCAPSARQRRGARLPPWVGQRTRRAAAEAPAMAACGRAVRPRLHRLPGPPRARPSLPFRLHLGRPACRQQPDAHRERPPLGRVHSSTPIGSSDLFHAAACRVRRLLVPSRLDQSLCRGPFSRSASRKNGLAWPREPARAQDAGRRRSPSPRAPPRTAGPLFRADFDSRRHRGPPERAGRAKGRPPRRTLSAGGRKCRWPEMTGFVNVVVCARRRRAGSDFCGPAHHVYRCALNGVPRTAQTRRVSAKC